MNRYKCSISIFIIMMANLGSSTAPPEAVAMQYQDLYLQGQEKTAMHYVESILSHTSLRGGGEEESDACKQSTYHFTEFHGTAQGALETLRAYTKQFEWTYEDRILLFRIGRPKPSLLDVIVKHFEFRPDEDPILIEGDLFGTDEVKKRIKEMGITHRSSEVGFARWRKPHEPEAPVVLKNLSVRDAVQEIVKHHDDHLSWVYMQYVCSGEYYSYFNWVSR